MKNPTNLKPGSAAPASGQYQQIGPKGGRGPEVTVPLGKPLPPTPKPGMTYNLVDRTDNASGRAK